MTNDDCWLQAVVVVKCAAVAMVVVDGGNSGRCQQRRQGARGEGDTDEGGRGREGKGKGGRGRAGEGNGIADDNGKQQEWASDDGVARRRSSKINKIG